MSKKSMSTLKLRNEETGEVEEYEIQDEEARKIIEKLTEEKADQSTIDEVAKRVLKKAEQDTVDNLDTKLSQTINNVDTKLTNLINADKTSGIKVEGTKLVIRV